MGKSHGIVKNIGKCSIMTVCHNSVIFYLYHMIENKISEFVEVSMKIVIKMLVDLTMMVMFLFLMFGYELSPLYHEVLGIGIGVVFLIHVLLNLKATKGILGSLVAGRLKGTTKANAILDVVLLVMMPLDIISGLLDSKFIIYSPYNSLISTAHHAFSWVVLAIIAGHLYLHRNYLKAAIKSKFLRGRQSKGNALALMGLVAIVGGVLFNSFMLVLNINDGSLDSTVSSNDDDDDDSSGTAQDNGGASTVTLDNYLSSLRCDGCGRHCSLASPQCGIGEDQADQATLEYESLYGQSESDTTDESQSTTDDSTSGSSESDQPATDGGVTDTAMTLNEYLKGFNCDGCGRRCSLANPKCGIGENQADQATLDYESLYGQEDSGNTSLVAATFSN